MTFRIPLAILSAAVTMALVAPSASAGPIERACIRSDRPAASRELCSCIQQVADIVLTRSDQRLAARFFRDPDLAQRIRQSDSRNHESFWQRYRSFGEAAQSYCG
ncbi:hypothetical protein SAMN05216257_10344 [Meinhardsimonia xiamenensis]|jgi:hypothetical protein|uniref:Uncharacterized protein n=1 Tax=Meinhardsimonia xiamenensis TaxID=990712 RepID=A0A1G9CAW2_9RHOB|nr:hypothetical protein [Meinhardsimonia xiamenensis]PRX38425.1 hypothetical protein LV81_00710 [Meinhardsimonia xiamenensis]SDK48828.1 hypothetical protein SAMN05216257_10344 [Meinhardsimonia xiamenensis]